MTIYGWVQIIFYLVILILLVKPLGCFMAKVYQGDRTFLSPVFGPIERLIYRTCGIHPDDEMDWKTYTIAMLIFNLVYYQPSE